jgi:hypothetical protein
MRGTASFPFKPGGHQRIAVKVIDFREKGGEDGKSSWRRCVTCPFLNLNWRDGLIKEGVATAKQTHESVRTAVGAYTWPGGVDYEVYLQGSYKNDTNIRSDSDVDVVVQLNSTCFENLPEDQKRRFGYRNASYGWQSFRSDVLKWLRNNYGSQPVSEGRKSLKVQTRYLAADVVVCLQYRKYPSYPRNVADYVEGMTSYVPSENLRVVNYPKIHYNNGVAKNFPSGTTR